MRALAERVTGIVDDVDEQLEGVEASGTVAVMATEESRKLVERAAAAARAISRVTQQQSAGTEQASQGMLEVADKVAVASRATSRPAPPPSACASTPPGSST